jgi:hypothetical protein
LKHCIAEELETLVVVPVWAIRRDRSVGESETVERRVLEPMAETIFEAHARAAAMRPGRSASALSLAMTSALAIAFLDDEP